jgi:hypothetical protein
MIEDQLIALAQAGDVGAKQLLFETHRTWIRTLAGNYWSSQSRLTRSDGDTRELPAAGLSRETMLRRRRVDTEIEDLFSAGVVAFFEALHTFKPGTIRKGDKPATLKTHAWRRVKRAIHRCYEKQVQLIPVGDDIVLIAQPAFYGLQQNRTANDPGSPGRVHSAVNQLWASKKIKGMSEWAYLAAAQANIFDAQFKARNGYPKDWSLQAAADDCDCRQKIRLQMMGRRAFAQWLVNRKSTVEEPMKKEPERNTLKIYILDSAGNRQLWTTWIKRDDGEGYKVAA